LTEDRLMQIDTTHHAPTDWDPYVCAHPNATAYHRASAVRVAADAFGLPVYFLTARGPDRKVTGVLPLVEQSSLLFGRYLVSVPYFTYGGILSSSPEASEALAKEAILVARARRSDHVELRHSAPLQELRLPERLDKVSMVLRLPRTETELGKQLGAKLRSQIKRAERENPEIVWGGKELIDEFYSVFASGMHELGTPVYSRKFFHSVCDAMGDLLAVIIVRVGGEAHAAAVVIRHGERIEVPWASATAAAKRGALNMRMYWEMLRYSIAAGVGEFDFGRSTSDSGTYRFKAQWGAEPMQLHWHYWLAHGGDLPKLNHSNPKYARAAALWRRMPLWCANMIGPQIARYLP
jgi:serine/alanine adding enzyme